MNRIEIEFDKSGRIRRLDGGPAPKRGDKLWLNGVEFGEVLCSDVSECIVKEMFPRDPHYMTALPIARDE